jgi:hypothetical protein
MFKRISTTIVIIGTIAACDLIVARSSDAGGFRNRWTTGRAARYNYANYYAPSPTTMNRQPHFHYAPFSPWYSAPTSYYYDSDYGPRPPGVAPW